MAYCLPSLCLASKFQAAAMASSRSTAAVAQNPMKPLGFLENAKKRKRSFIQFFAMTGILLLSVRSLGQKWRIHDLLQYASALREESDALTSRMDGIKRDLRHEASMGASSLFAPSLATIDSAVGSVFAFYPIIY